MRFLIAWLMLAASACLGAEPDKPVQWVIAAKDVNVIAGERFELLVISLAGEPLPDEIELRMRVVAEERVVKLAAVGPAQGDRRSYAGTMPIGVTGPTAVELWISGVVMGGASAGRSSGAVSAMERCNASLRGPACGLRPVCSASI